MTTTTETIDYGKLAGHIADLALFYAEKYSIKVTTAETLLWWSATARPCGDFATAVLSNDLKRACMHADRENARDLGNIVRFIFNRLPGNCWGSYPNVEAWKGGLLPRFDDGLVPVEVALRTLEETP